MTDEQPMSEQPVQEPAPESAAPESAAPESVDLESIDPVKKPKKPSAGGASPPSPDPCSSSRPS